MHYSCSFPQEPTRGCVAQKQWVIQIRDRYRILETGQPTRERNERSSQDDSKSSLRVTEE